MTKTYIAVTLVGAITGILLWWGAMTVAAAMIK
jgi:hypothetical protein